MTFYSTNNLKIFKMLEDKQIDKVASVGGYIEFKQQHNIQRCLEASPIQWLNRHLSRPIFVFGSTKSNLKGQKVIQLWVWVHIPNSLTLTNIDQ